MVASYVRERDRIFRRWLENVERLLNQPSIAARPSRHGATATASANMPVRCCPRPAFGPALMPLTMRPTLADAPAVKREAEEDWGR